jgi:peptidoglycan-associated lipoprotein
LAAIFRNVYFNTDDHVLREKSYYDTLTKISDFLKKHQDTYVFIEGHCDERASESYNLALGTRRSCFVRNLLVKQGVSPDQLFTISYGKERPVDLRHTKDAWAKNRRTEFKIFNKKRA